LYDNTQQAYVFTGLSEAALVCIDSGEGAYRDMLLKLHTGIFRTVTILWVTYLLTGAADQAEQIWRVGLDGWDRVAGRVLIAVLSLVLGWRFIALRRTVGVQDLERAISRLIAKTYPAVSVIRSVAILGSGGLFLLLSAFFFWCSLAHGTRTLAQLTDRLGNYELAERFYSMNPDRNRFQLRSSMAVWHDYYNVESVSVRNARNSAIAHVYGKDSVEMASRYYFIGCNLEEGSKKKDPLEAADWYWKAYNLYHLHGVHNRCVHCLIEVAFVCSEYKQIEKEHNCLRQASYELQGIRDRSSIWSLCIGEKLAHDLGDSDLASQFRGNAAAAVRTQKNDYPGADVLLWVFIAAVGITSGFPTAAVREVLIGNIYIQKLRAVRTATYLSDLLSTLSDLVDLDLFRGNLEGADKSGRAMLNAVGVKVDESTKPTCCDWMRSRLKKLFRDQSQAAAFMLTFLYIWKT